MNIIQWLRPSLEGKDGKSSARAITNFWYVGLNTLIALSTIILAFLIIDKTDSQVNKYSVDVLWALIWLTGVYNITVLLVFGIVSLQQVTELSRSIRGENSSPPITVETKTTTEIKQDENKGVE